MSTQTIIRYKDFKESHEWAKWQKENPDTAIFSFESIEIERKLGSHHAPNKGEIGIVHGVRVYYTEKEG